MKLFFICLSVSALFLTLMYVWYTWMSYSSFFYNRKESAPYECGFEPSETARSPFSLRFFLILMMFLMFDVELSFLLQIPEAFRSILVSKEMIYFFMMVILLAGLMEEWREGLLTWRP